MTSATSGLTKSRIVAIQIYHTVPTSNLHLHRTAPPWWQKIAKLVRIQGCDVERMQWNVLTGQDYFRDREATALSSELFLRSESFDAHSWTFEAAFIVRCICLCSGPFISKLGFHFGTEATCFLCSDPYFLTQCIFTLLIWQFLSPVSTGATSCKALRTIATCEREEPEVASYEVVLDRGLELCTFKEYCAADRP